MNTKDYEKQPVDVVLKELSVNPKEGLSEEEVKKRIKQYGYNEIPEKEESTLHRFLRRFWGPIPWMIEIAIVLSFIVKKWDDFTIITILLFINAFLDFWQESKALDALKVLKKKLAKTAIVFRDGKFISTDVKNLVPGDIVKLKMGDIVPADVKLISGDYISIDQSALTGESLPVFKKVGDLAYANSVAKKGEMLAVVVRTGLNTYFGKTVGLVSDAQRGKRSHFQKMVVKVGNFLIVLAILMISWIILVGLSRKANPLELFRFSLVLTVASIPVALPAVLTVTMAVGALNLAKKQAIVSRLAAIEELAGMDILCSDKTGTLTQNKMSLSKPYVVNGFDEDKLLFYAGLASKEENHDSIEMPIFDYLKEHKLYGKLKDYELEKFIPFDPVIKRTQATLVHNGKRLIVTKGAPQVILEMSDRSEFDVKEAKKVVSDFADKGFRTLGVAYKTPKEDDFHFCGFLPLFDPPRPDSKEAIADAKAHGVGVKLVTGDNLAIAKYIANLLNIGNNVLDVHELKGQNYKEYTILTEVIAKALYKKLSKNVSDKDIDSFAKSITAEVKKELNNIKLPEGYVKKHESEIIEIIEKSDGFAQVFPEDKYFIVTELQKAGHIVGMTGDGVNDAPALKKADTGIAVSGATDAARAAADLVLLTPGLKVIVDAIKEARVTFERMKSYATYRIAETIRVILFMTFSIVFFNFYPVTALMIILIALLNDIAILAIAYDNTVVDNKPVRWNMHNMLTLSTSLGVAGVISSFTIFFILMSFRARWGLTIGMIQSIMFLKLIVAGHLTIYNTRREDWFWKKPYPSKILIEASLGAMIIATVFAVYGFHLIDPVGWKVAGLVWLYALSWFVFNDCVKMIVLKMRKHNKVLFADNHIHLWKKEHKQNFNGL